MINEGNGTIGGRQCDRRGNGAIGGHRRWAANGRG